MDQHDLVVAIKNLAVEIGRTPTKQEFCNRVPGGTYKIPKLFGSYNVLVAAAGLDTYSERRSTKPLGNDLFQADVADRVQAFKPQPSDQPKDLISTLVIGDCHFPFASQRVLDAIFEFALKSQPQRIVQIGDLYDLYSFSKFPKSANVYIPKEEQSLGRKHAEGMWAELRKVAPQAECVQIKGNHDLRPMKQTLAHLPALEHVVARYLDELMTFPGVQLISDERQEHVGADGVAFIHGYKSGLGPHRDFMLSNVACGHSHLGGVTYRRIRGQTLWELNAGFVGDPEAKAFNYTPQKTVNWTPGFGYIHPFGPQFIPV
jgi:predicted phosphodiesterase